MASAAGVLPPREDLTDWLGAIVERDGLGVLLRALVQSVGRDRFMATVEEVCSVRWGDEPIITDDSGQQVGLHVPMPNAQFQTTAAQWQAQWESSWVAPSPARSTGSSVGTAMLTPSASHQGEQRGPVPAGYFHGRCWHCEPDFGREDETCEAMSVLESLSLDMDIREDQMHEEEEARAPMRSPRT